MSEDKQLFEQCVNAYAELEEASLLKQQFQQACEGKGKAMVQIALFFKEYELFANTHNWLRRAVDLHNADGLYELANCYFEGLGVEENEQQAFYYYEKAAMQNHPDAMNNLADMYLNGEGTQIDEEKAFIWFKEAATVGVVEAMFTLGIMHEQGLGTQVDETMAYRYYEQAAQGGDVEGLYRMGMIYFTGELTQKQSYEQAFTWFLRAANQFHVDALYNIAYCYEHGLGVEKSVPNAIRTYQQAALLGDSAATLKITERRKENIIQGDKE